MQPRTTCSGKYAAHSTLGLSLPTNNEDNPLWTPDIGSSQLRLPSQVTPSCVKVTLEARTMTKCMLVSFKLVRVLTVCTESKVSHWLNVGSRHQVDCMGSGVHSRTVSFRGWWLIALRLYFTVTEEQNFAFPHCSITYSRRKHLSADRNLLTLLRFANLKLTKKIKHVPLKIYVNLP